MPAETTPPASQGGSAVTRPPSLGWQRLPARAVGWLLLGCCAVLAVTAAVAGERPSSYADLRAAVHRHDVDEVRVTGALAAPYHGPLVVDVHWRTWSGGHVARVVQAHPRRSGRRAAERWMVPAVGSVSEDLQRRDPAVRVVEEPERPSTTELLGWRLPEWVGVLTVVLVLGTAVSLLAGPPTWRATKWAWFWWLLLLPPVGVPAFLLLGGPTGLWPPASLDRRTRGGWAFLLALIVSVAVDTVVAAT